MLLFAELLMILLGVLSFALWGKIIRQKLVGLPVIPFRVREPIRWSPLVLIVTFCWIALQVVGQVQLWFETKRSAASLESLQGSNMINFILLISLLVLLSKAGERRLSEFGISWGNWKRETLYGLLGFSASLLPVFLVQLASLKWEFRTEETQHSLLKLLQENPGPETILWITLAAVVMAPLTEELVFRVILQGSLQSKLSPKTAIAISSIVFAGVHGFPDSLALVPLAVILGYVYHRRHSYLAVVVLHALFNLLNLILSQLSLQPDESASTVSLLW